MRLNVIKTVTYNHLKSNTFLSKTGRNQEISSCLRLNFEMNLSSSNPTRHFGIDPQSGTQEAGAVERSQVRPG